MTFLTMSWTTSSGTAGVTSPKTATQLRDSSLLMPDSQATRAIGVCDSAQSRTASEIWSHILSGWPSVTLSLLNNRWAWVWNVVLKVWSAPSLDGGFRWQFRGLRNGRRRRLRSWRAVWHARHPPGRGAGHNPD